MASRGCPGSYRFAEHVADLVGLIEALELPPAVLVGHSMGGPHVAALAAPRPELVHSIVFEDPHLRDTARHIERPALLVTGDQGVDRNVTVGAGGNPRSPPPLSHPDRRPRSGRWAQHPPRPFRRSV